MTDEGNVSELFVTYMYITVWFIGQYTKRPREQYLVQLAREDKDIIHCDGHIAIYVTPMCLEIRYMKLA